MSKILGDSDSVFLKTLTISGLVVLLLFLWQGSKGFNLWDEGFLWYGVQRVLLGEVPIRDFMAYDPGRYYWSAALVSIFGDNGIMSIRAAVAVFQALGLFVGLLLVAQSEKFKRWSDIVYWLLSAVIFVVWMFPRHKLFDISISIFLIGVLTYLVRHPISKRYFIAGMSLGFVAVFGRNHGVYGAAGSLGVIAYLSVKNNIGPGFIKAIIVWGAGVMVGFLPIIFMAIIVPGFAIAFWESIYFLFEQRTTNLPLPIPWPWTVNFASISIWEAVQGVLLGVFFIGTLVFAGLSVLWIVSSKLKGRKIPPAFVASAFLAFPYSHYAFSRADIGHLAQGIFPLLIGSLVILSTVQARIKWLLAAMLCAASIVATHAVHPGWQELASKQYVNIEISGSILEVDPDTAGNIILLRQLVEQYATNGQTFIATPFWPGAYALFGRRSPMWEIYALFPRSDAFENKEIERIKISKPAFALIFDLPLDGRDELRFKNTHPLIHQYILNNFDTVEISQNPAYQIYKARNKGK